LFQQAVENPTSTEIQDVCAAVGFNVLLEVIKKNKPQKNLPKLGMCSSFIVSFLTDMINYSWAVFVTS